MSNIINAAIMTTASASIAQAKPAADPTKNSKTTIRTGVKSVDEQHAENKANEDDKEKAEVENKGQDSTTAQSKLNDGKITAASISSALNPKTDDKTTAPAKANSAWEQFINSRFPKEGSTTSDVTGTQSPSPLNSANQMPNAKDMQTQMQNDAATVANNFGLSSPDQNQNSSSQQQSQSGPSGQGFGAGPGGSGSGGYFNNVVMNNGNVVGNTFVGDTSAISGGSVVDGPAQSAPINDRDQINNQYFEQGNSQN